MRELCGLAWQTEIKRLLKFQMNRIREKHEEPSNKIIITGQVQINLLVSFHCFPTTSGPRKYSEYGWILSYMNLVHWNKQKAETRENRGREKNTQTGGNRTWIRGSSNVRQEEMRLPTDYYTPCYTSVSAVATCALFEPKLVRQTSWPAHNIWPTYI